MSLYAIADTHLSFGTDKPMDSFEGWQDYTSRLEKNWNKLVEEDDDVVIAGDISWAMDFFRSSKQTLIFLESLNGNKIIFKGNHDYWWNTMAKLNKFFWRKNNYKNHSLPFSTIRFELGNASICGTRGWMMGCENEEDIKILNREVGRLRRSLESAGCPEKIVFLHYPPVSDILRCDEIINVLNEFGIKKCYYGHLHGDAAKICRFRCCRRY
ncbi:MAG: metallophosphoesterase [Anaerotruncus sp.]|nr:MAG: metallophosphoesterase [Anaerotruncus sp.]